MFEKNFEFLTAEEVSRIRKTKAAVVGLGALGQMAAQELVRAGFEELILVDGDCMDPGNLNRQLYADILTMGQPKTQVVCERLGDISPRLKITEHTEFLNPENGERLLKGADLLLDCVDNIPTKQYLEKLAGALEIPLIHGAVEGWCGQAAVIFPGERLMEVLYQNKVEQETSALVMTVNVIASVQAAEALKIAAGRECALRQKIFCADLLNEEFQAIPVSYE